MGFRTTVAPSVFIVAIIWLWPDSRQSELPSRPRCCLCSSLIWLRVPASLEKYPSSGGFTIDPHFLRGDIPSSTHTFCLDFTDKVCNGDILGILWQSRWTARETFPWAATPGELTPHSTKSETPQFRFNTRWSMSPHVALPFTVLYYQVLYYFNAFPVMSSWGQAQKQGMLVALWLAEAPVKLSQWWPGVAAGCHENGQAGGVGLR